MALRRKIFPLFTFVVALLAAREAAALSLVPGPTITSVVPLEATFAGGETMTIRGSGFHAPLRVFFEMADAKTEAFVLSTAENSILIATPRIELPPQGWRLASLFVLVRAGTVEETRVTGIDSVRFVDRNAPPQVVAVSPRFGSRSGVTRVTIFGSGFRAPVQLFAVGADGSERELQLIAIRFDEVVAIIGPGAPGESVGFRIVDYNSGKSVTFPDAFHYTKPMSIANVTPASGPSTGGTRVTIDGSGFVDPSAVVIGGIAAQPVSVTDTQIIAITGAFPDLQCGDHAGGVTVISLETGESADAAPFTFTSRTEFASVPIKATAGASITVRVTGGSELMDFALDGQRVAIESLTANGDGTTTYRLRLPLDEPLRGRNCRVLPFTATLAATNLRTGCHDARALTIVPTQNDGPCPQPRARS